MEVLNKKIKRTLVVDSGRLLRLIVSLLIGAAAVPFPRRSRENVGGRGKRECKQGVKHPSATRRRRHRRGPSAAPGLSIAREEKGSAASEVFWSAERVMIRFGEVTERRPAEGTHGGAR